MKKINFLPLITLILMLIQSINLQFFHESITHFDIRGSFEPDVVSPTGLINYLDSIGMSPYFTTTVSPIIFLFFFQIIFIIVYTYAISKNSIVITKNNKIDKLIYLLPLVVISLRIVTFILFFGLNINVLDYYLILTYYEYSIISLILDILNMIILIYITYNIYKTTQNKMGSQNV